MHNLSVAVAIAATAYNKYVHILLRLVFQFRHLHIIAVLKDETSANDVESYISQHMALETSCICTLCHGAKSF